MEGLHPRAARLSFTPAPRPAPPLVSCWLSRRPAPRVPGPRDEGGVAGSTAGLLCPALGGAGLRVPLRVCSQGRAVGAEMVAGAQGLPRPFPGHPDSSHFSFQATDGTRTPGKTGIWRFDRWKVRDKDGTVMGRSPQGCVGLSDYLPPQQLACRYRGSGRGFGDAREVPLEIKTDTLPDGRASWLGDGSSSEASRRTLEHHCPF